jgi:DNA-binding LytR/AlgR family response regulator
MPQLEVGARVGAQARDGGRVGAALLSMVRSKKRRATAYANQHHLDRVVQPQSTLRIASIINFFLSSIDSE